MAFTRSFMVRVLAAALGLLSAYAALRAQSLDALFDDTGALQEIRFRMNTRDWQALKDNFELDTYYPADLSWRGLTLRNVGIRSRGNTTRNPFKPGLRVDFNRYLSKQEFLGLKAMALDNMYSDVSLVRETIAMKLFVKLGFVAPRESHARVYVNNEYIGAYVIIESLDRPFISRMWGAPEANVESGGYLYEYNWVRPYGFETLGNGLEAYAELFTPKTRETDSTAGLYSPIKELIRAINESPDDRFVQEVEKYIDLHQFIRYLAVENFLADEDGLVGQWGLHNFYLYRFRDGRPWQLIPWDKDKTFSPPNHPIDYQINTDVLFARAMTFPELRQIYFDALLSSAALAEEPGADDARGWLEREIDREIGRVQPALVEDSNYPFSMDDFDVEADFLRQFARTRTPFVRCQVARATRASDVRQTCSAPGSRPRR